MAYILNRVKTWGAEILYASDLNAEFDNIIDNLTPAQINDLSNDVTAMQATSDPYVGQTEVKATTLKLEVQQLRYLIAQLTGQTYWYQDPSITLEAVKAPNNNILHNGDFRVAQQGASFTSATSPANSDDTYLLDRWVLLSDGNDIVDVTQTTTVPTGALNSIGLDVETASKKFGILQIVENKNISRIKGGVASLSFQAKVTSDAAGRLDNIKAVVLSWDSTADVVTSDVVSAWNAEDTTPTWAANWTQENAPSNLGVASTFAKYKIENISIDTASANNIAVFVWSDGYTGTVTDFLHITDVKLEEGVIATDYPHKSEGSEYADCTPHFERINYASAQVPVGSGHRRSTTLTNIYIAYGRKRSIPSSVNLSDNTDFKVVSGSGSDSSISSIVKVIGKNTVRFLLTHGAFGAEFNGATLESNAADTYLDIDANL